VFAAVEVESAVDGALLAGGEGSDAAGGGHKGDGKGGELNHVC